MIRRQGHLWVQQMETALHASAERPGQHLMCQANTPCLSTPLCSCHVGLVHHLPWQHTGVIEQGGTHPSVVVGVGRRQKIEALVGHNRWRRPCTSAHKAILSPAVPDKHPLCVYPRLFVSSGGCSSLYLTNTPCLSTSVCSWQGGAVIGCRC